LRAAAARLQAAGADGLPVLDDGQLVGILTRHGIGRLVYERSLLARPPR
jgi:CBS domain-containing protein